MTPERWQRIKVLLEEAETISAESRPDWLRLRCAGDESLEEEVAAMLAHEDSLETFIEQPAIDSLLNGTGLEDDADLGRTVGPYRLEEKLGQGGMGAVYRASRLEGFEQTVAIKLLPAGMDHSRALERFQRERQILARLEHPNIAHLLDGGATADGRPWFAMEVVDGVPIDQFCIEKQLDVRRRLELVLPLCDALQFAHRNLVIHRDLKPSNILVTASGVPKLLDFGIAKWLISDAFTATEQGVQPMTLRYASPEQVLDEPITTASDIYSFGVVLYQLLTGVLPCDLDRCANAQIFRAISEAPPRPPSDELTRHTGDVTRPLTFRPDAVADLEVRRRYRRILRGDVDAIVLKALRKEPDLRFSSIEQLGADLRRYLDGLPVEARQGSWTYRAGKYVRRHRWPLGAAASTLGLILAFTLILARQLEETSLQRDRAERALAFLTGLFEGARPGERGEEPSVRQLVDEGRRQLETELEDVPELRAGLLNTLGQVYDRLGHYEAGLETLTRSVEAFRQQHRGDHPDVAQALNDLGVIAYRRGRYERAEQHTRESLAMRRRLGLESDLIKPMNNLAAILRLRGKLDEAKRIYLDGLEHRRSRFGDVHANVAKSLVNLGFTSYLAGDFEAAEDALREALDIRLELFDPGSPTVASVLAHLGRVHHAEGRWDRAEAYYQQALDIRRRRLDAGHLELATLERDYAGLLVERGDHETAGILIGSALSSLQASKPLGDPLRAEAESIYGAYLLATDRRTEAEVCLRQAADILIDVRGAEILPSRQATERLGRLASLTSAP